MKPLRILALLVTVGFVLLLIVGFDNVLALFRSRVALGLALAPLLGLFLWCLYKAFRSPPPQLPDRTFRDKKST